MGAAIYKRPIKILILNANASRTDEKAFKMQKGINI